MEFPLPLLEAHSWALSATCGRSENVGRVRDILKPKIKLFFNKYLFGILISLSQNLI